MDCLGDVFPQNFKVHQNFMDDFAAASGCFSDAEDLISVERLYESARNTWNH